MIQKSPQKHFVDDVFLKAEARSLKPRFTHPSAAFHRHGAINAGRMRLYFYDMLYVILLISIPTFCFIDNNYGKMN